jgi:hypothetical protein
MNTEQMKTLLESVIKLFQTIDILGKTNLIPREIVTCHKVKRLFIDLTHLELKDIYQLQVYEFKGGNFQLVAK